QHLRSPTSATSMTSAFGFVASRAVSNRGTNHAETLYPRQVEIPGRSGREPSRRLLTRSRPYTWLTWRTPFAIVSRLSQVEASRLGGLPLTCGARDPCWRRKNAVALRRGPSRVSRNG